MGPKGAIGLDLDWVTPIELEVSGLVMIPTKTNDQRSNLSVAVASIILFPGK